MNLGHLEKLRMFIISRKKSFEMAIIETSKKTNLYKQNLDDSGTATIWFKDHLHKNPQ